MNLAQAYEAIDGMKWTLEGVAGILRVERVNGITEIVHHASAAGRKTDAYRQMRARLGDDYTTTITDPDDLGPIFAQVEGAATSERQ